MTSGLESKGITFREDGGVTIDAANVIKWLSMLEQIHAAVVDEVPASDKLRAAAQEVVTARYDTSDIDNGRLYQAIDYLGATLMRDAVLEEKKKR